MTSRQRGVAFLVGFLVVITYVALIELRDARGIASASSTATRDRYERIVDSERRHVRSIEQRKTTLRFFRAHPEIFAGPARVRAIGIRARTEARIAIERRELRALRRAIVRMENDPQTAIRIVFGDGWLGQEALRVSYCETGGTFSIFARNGQYENIFQMGTWERRTYGWHTVGSSPLIAARAAKRYYDAAGGWGPWECKP